MDKARFQVTNGADGLVPWEPETKLRLDADGGYFDEEVGNEPGQSDQARQGKAEAVPKIEGFRQDLPEPRSVPLVQKQPAAQSSAADAAGGSK